MLNAESPVTMKNMQLLKAEEMYHSISLTALMMLVDFIDRRLA
jgi:hypothetical protein